MGKRILVFLVVAYASGCTSESGSPASDATGSTSSPSVVTDVVYGHTYGLALTLDVYVPERPNGAGVILTNSGGWQSPYDVFKVEEPDGYRYATDEEMTASGTWHVLSPRRVVEAGFTVFEVRHGSQAKFDMPEIVDHVRQAVQFVSRSAHEYGVDPTRIGLWGGSASGHLSLLVGLSPEVPLSDTTRTSDFGAAMVQAIVAFAAPADLAMFVHDDPQVRERRRVLQLSADAYHEFSPTSYASADDPPTLIMHGNADEAVPIAQGRAMFAALQRAGVQSEFVEFDSTTHSPSVQQAERGVTEALRWFEAHLLHPEG
jgi:predicted esterase